MSGLVTQNVDGLHQRAGSRRVIELHGRLQEVECLECGARCCRQDVQELLVAWNRPFLDGLGTRTPAARPDGDVDLEGDFSAFRVPDCPACGGILKPAVVFFGESVPRARVDKSLGALGDADALLVVGSSLMVFSGYRFCLAAAALGKPIAAVNLGRGRADDMFALRLAADCGPTLQALAGALGLAGRAATRPAV